MTTESNTKVLITGVAGLIGSRLADGIIENMPDVQVVGIDDLSGGYIENVNPKVKFVEGDVRNRGIRELFEEEQFDYVYHLAAYAAEGLSPFIRTFNYENNLVATANIVNECIRHSVKRLVFTSTLAVYGHGQGGVFDERAPRAPIDPYGVAKAACEMDIEIAGEQHGLDWCILRPHNVYGAKQNIWDKYRNVLGIWMCNYMNGEPLTIYGDGTQVRAFSYVDDMLYPMWNAADSPLASKQIINLGGIHQCTINEAADTLIEVMGGGEKVYLEGRHEVHTAVTTYEKSRNLLSFNHKTDLKEGLTKMWEWAQTQPKRERKKWEQYELDHGMYSFWK